MNDGRPSEGRFQFVGGRSGEVASIERPSQTLGEQLGPIEGPFHWELLIEQHPDQESQPARSQKLVGVLILGERE